MFNFLNATVLFAAAASLIPLIIHLFSKRKVKVIEFSSIRHLKAMQKRQVRRLKIRQLLLLLLRMLIIFTVVMAFARPTTEGGQIGAHAAVSAVVLFDNSASMNRFVTDGSLFELAKNRTGMLLETFGEADEVFLLPLVTGADEDMRPHFGSAAAAHEKLNRLEPAFQAADLSAALGKATELLGNAVNLNKEVYLVTDRQKSLLPDSAYLADSKAITYLLDLPMDDNENLGVASVDFGGQLIIPGHDFTLSATVRNYGGFAEEDVIASLFLDGSRTAQTDFDVDAGGEATVRFTRSVNRTGFHSGYIEISDDKFMVDNRAYFSFTIPERFNVLIIDGDRTGALLSLALVPAPQLNQYWSVKTVMPENLTGVDFRDYDVIVAAGAPDVADSHLERLKQFLSRGKAVFVTYGAQTDPQRFNSRWSEICGVTVERHIDPNFSRAGFYSFLSFDVTHPIFSVFEFENNKPPELKFYTLPTASLRRNAHSLLRFSGDRPALVEYTYDQGRVLTFTGLIAPEYSDISAHAFFVPFVSRIAEYLASDLSSYDLHLYCGENISRSMPSVGAITSSVELLTPDSSVYALTPEESQGRLFLRVEPSSFPGIYSVRFLGREIDRLSINLTPAEGDLAAADPDRFAAALGAPTLNRLGNNVNLAEAVAQFRFGKELWPIFLWMAALFIVLELLLSRSAPDEAET